MGLADKTLDILYSDTLLAMPRAYNAIEFAAGLYSGYTGDVAPMYAALTGTIAASTTKTACEHRDTQNIQQEWPGKASNAVLRSSVCVTAGYALGSTLR